MFFQAGHDHDHKAAARLAAPTPKVRPNLAEIIELSGFVQIWNDLCATILAVPDRSRTLL